MCKEGDYLGILVYHASMTYIRVSGRYTNVALCQLVLLVLLRN